MFKYKKNILLHGVLKNNEMITINCESELREHAIFSAFVDNTTNERYVSLTQFELTNIIITKDE